MGTASKYWKLIRLDTTGKRQIQEVASVKAFFYQRFPELKNQIEVSDRVIQNRLLTIYRDPSIANSDRLMTECCLRCFISHQIEQTCIQLELRFGSEHGFTRYDLFVFVLDDTFAELNQPRQYKQSNLGTYQPMTLKILQTFDEEKASLSTWTNRLVKHERELNTFLLEHGVYLVSDWAILNDTQPKQLQRILAEFHSLTEVEIEQAKVLLESYHQIYRQARLEKRQAGVKGKCPPPSVDQLEQIASLFERATNLRLSPEPTLARLQTVASWLRQYRIHVRGGSLPTQAPVIEPRYHPHPQDDDEPFLSFYRQQFIKCLDRGLNKVIQARLNYLQRKHVGKAKQFVIALELFYCQGKAMGAIAPVIGLKAQFQVTRLLKLKAFRADLQQQILQDLLPCIVNEAAKLSDPEGICFAVRDSDYRRSRLELQTREQQIATALKQQIIADLEGDSKVKTRTVTSVLAQRLCGYLKDVRRETDYDR